MGVVPEPFPGAGAGLLPRLGSGRGCPALPLHSVMAEGEGAGEGEGCLAAALLPYGILPVLSSLNWKASAWGSADAPPPRPTTRG